jgi:16S rRNA (cytidine1402-2'-O)-methyltransferase
LRALADESRTVVVFESPQRIRDTLADIDGLIPERRLVLGRELTKLHETILRGTAAELLERLGDSVRGEITLALAGAAPGRAEVVDLGGREVLSRWREALQAAGGDRRQALRQAARTLGLKRAELQRRLAELDPQA